MLDRSDSKSKMLARFFVTFRCNSFHRKERIFDMKQKGRALILLLHVETIYTWKKGIKSFINLVIVSVCLLSLLDYTTHTINHSGQTSLFSFETVRKQMEIQVLDRSPDTSPPTVLFHAHRKMMSHPISFFGKRHSWTPITRNFLNSGC